MIITEKFYFITTNSAGKCCKLRFKDYGNYSCILNQFIHQYMLQSTVITKLAIEYCLSKGDFSDYKDIRRIVTKALSIGIEHFSSDMNEVVGFDKYGNRIRFKSFIEAANKLQIDRRNMTHAVNNTFNKSRKGKKGYFVNTIKGYKFVREEDYSLEEESVKIKPGSIVTYPEGILGNIPYKYIGNNDKGEAICEDKNGNRFRFTYTKLVRATSEQKEEFYKIKHDANI